VVAAEVDLDSWTVPVADQGPLGFAWT